MGEFVIGVLFLLLSIFVFIKGRMLPQSSFDPLGPAVFPRVIVFVMGFLAIALIVKKVIELIKSRDIKNFIDNASSIREIVRRYRWAFITVIGFFLYIGVMKYVGFRISTFCFLFTIQWVLSLQERRNWPAIIVTTLIISLGSYYFFRDILGVVFPAGVLFE